MGAEEILIQGGAVGIALATLTYSWKKDKLINETIKTAFKRIEDDRRSDIDSRMELAKAISGLQNKITDCGFKTHIYDRGKQDLVNNKQ